LVIRKRSWPIPSRDQRERSPTRRRRRAVAGTVAVPLASQPPDVAVAVHSSNSCAEGLIEIVHWPSVLYIRMDHYRYSRPHKRKFHLWSSIASRTALPGSLKVSLFDWATKFRYEPLHEDTLVPDWSPRPASEVLGHDERQVGCGAQSRREKFRWTRNWQRRAVSVTACGQVTLHGQTVYRPGWTGWENAIPASLKGRIPGRRGARGIGIRLAFRVH
jgi:hypothetical protein